MEKRLLKWRKPEVTEKSDMGIRNLLKHSKVESRERAYSLLLFTLLP